MLHDPHVMGKTGAPLALTASVASFVVVIAEKSKFSVKSVVYKVKGSIEFFCHRIKTAEHLLIFLLMVC